MEEDIQEFARIMTTMEQGRGKTTRSNQPCKRKFSPNSSIKTTQFQYPPKALEKCLQCGKIHPGECRVANHACFRYGKSGHFIKDCPQ